MGGHYHRGNGPENSSPLITIIQSLRSFLLYFVVIPIKSCRLYHLYWLKIHADCQLIVNYATITNLYLSGFAIFLLALMELKLIINDVFIAFDAALNGLNQFNYSVDHHGYCAVSYQGLVGCCFHLNLRMKCFDDWNFDPFHGFLNFLVHFLRCLIHFTCHSRSLESNWPSRTRYEND